LLILGVWLAKVVYGDMITPLYMKLVESQTIIERQEKLASLGVLAAGVAHEIRNPLTAIKARLFTQQKTLKSGSPEFEDARVIGNEINRLERIVKDVLQFARPAEPSLTTISASAPLREVCDFLAPDLEKRGIVLKVDAVTDARIRADPQQLKQVLINLIQNSAESIERDGTILLRARATSEALRGEVKPVVVLEVIDTGKGIPLEVQKRLFDPFFSTKESGKGTGLGLSTVLGIVKGHNGFINTYSEVGRGTRFTVYLPAAAGAGPAARREPAPEPPSGHGERILVIDDEKAVQEISQSILKKYGYEVMTAGDGAEALAMFAQHREEIDLVLCDIMMPFLDGPATIRALQKIAPDVCVIAASGLLENEAVATTFPNVSFLLKPFTTEELLIAVNAALQKRAQSF
jgi:nitrogen-specific signal transduction histidine kinase/CheY-like chemotaxis protein